MQPTSTQILKINQKQNKKLKGGFNMFKTMKKRIKNEKGLTLIELLAVVVILAIVAAIAVPAIGNIIDNSRYSAIKADAVNVINAAQLYYTENPGGQVAANAPDGTATTTSITAAQLQTAGFLETAGSIAGTATVTAVKPHKLVGNSTKKVNNQTVSFNATIERINADTTKGSSLTETKTIQ